MKHQLHEEDFTRISSLLQTEHMKHSATFPEIIGKTYDEETISRILAYLLQIDFAFAASLLDYGQEKRITLRSCQVECEKCLPGGRIDIFLTARDTNGLQYTLTIENKINSWEHNDQTQTYYRYITANYRQSRNTFLFLKPTYNQSPCKCPFFVPITYKELLPLISACDPVAEDFKRHIREYFTEKEIHVSECVKEVLKHYNEFREILAEAEKILVIVQRDIFQALRDEIIDTKEVWGTEISGGSHRIFKKVWWHDGLPHEKYFFYSEIYFVRDSPQEIVVQSTVKRYGTRTADNSLYRFLCDTNAEGTWDNAYFVHYKAEFHSDSEFFSERWQDELKRFARKEMKIAIDQSDRLFSEYQAFLADDRTSAAGR